MIRTNSACLRLFALLLVTLGVRAVSSAIPPDTYNGTLAALTHLCTPVTGDSNGDRDLDLADFSSLQACLDLSGPNSAASYSCQSASADGDSDIDLADAAQFMNAFTSFAIGGMFHFTLGNDDLEGTPVPDVFIADLVFDPLSGTGVQSLQSGDNVYGLGGYDRAKVTVNQGLPYSLYYFSSIEALEVTDIGPIPSSFFLDSQSEHCAVQTTSSTSLGPTLFYADQLINTAMVNHGSGMALRFATDATFGASDELSLVLSGATGGVFSIETGTANGVESLDLISEGPSNFLDGLVQTTGNTLTEIHVSGDAPLFIANPLPPTIDTVNGASSTGGIRLNISAASGGTTLIGGSGDDEFNFGGNYMPIDQVDGGLGIDTLVLTSSTVGGAVFMQGNVANVEALTIADALKFNFYSLNFGDITRLDFLNGVAGIDPLTLPSLFIEVGEGMRLNFNSGTDNRANIILISLLMNAPLNVKQVTVALNDHDFFGLSSHYVDEIHLQSNRRLDGGPADLNGNSFFGPIRMEGSMTTLRLTGSANVVFHNDVGVTVLDASQFLGNLTMTPTSNPSGHPRTLLAGSGNDTLYLWGFFLVVDGGPGNDIIDGFVWQSTLSLGAGADIVRASDSSKFNCILDFTPGVGGDKVNLDRNTVGTLDGNNNFTSSAAIQEHIAPASLYFAPGTEIVRVTSGTVPTFPVPGSQNGADLLAAIGGPITSPFLAGQYLFLVSDDAGSTGIYFGQAGPDTDISQHDLSLWYVLEGVNINSLVYTNFSNLN